MAINPQIACELVIGTKPAGSLTYRTACEFVSRYIVMFMAETVSRALIKRFALLSCVAEQYMDELLAHCYLKSVSVGGVVLRKKKEQDQVQCYLIQGQIGIWHSFKERIFLDHNTVECQQPLNDLLHGGGVIRAISPCRVLRVNNHVLSRLLASSATEGDIPSGGGRCGSGPDYFDKAMAAIFEAVSTVTQQGTVSLATDGDSLTLAATATKATTREETTGNQAASLETDALEVDEALNPLKIVAR